MATRKKTTTPKEYVVVAGRISFKGEHNNRLVVSHDETDENGLKIRFPLNHLEPMTVKYLVEVKRQLMEADAWEQSPEGQTWAEHAHAQSEAQAAAANAKAETLARLAESKRRANEKAAQDS